MIFAQVLEAASRGTDQAVYAAWAAAGFAALSIPANLWISRNRLKFEQRKSDERLAHEERMQTERLARDAAIHAQRRIHERREAAAMVAASAYNNAAQFFNWLSPSIREVLGKTKYTSSAIEQRRSATKELRYVVLFGWNSRVRKSADRLIEAVFDLNYILIVLTNAEKLPDFGHGPAENADNIPERYQSAIDALDDYARAVVGNGPQVADSDTATGGRTDRGAEDGERTTEI